jgi:two-component system chemotaxis response regulator CheB
VHVARHGEQVRPGQAYVAPDDAHLGLSPGRALLLSDDPPREGFRPSASHLFESVARVLGSRSLAVILTGMGRDGVDGLKAVRSAGGVVLAQDRGTSVVYGMPGAAFAEGVTSEVLPVSRIANRILEVVGHER